MVCSSKLGGKDRFTDDDGGHSDASMSEVLSLIQIQKAIKKPNTRNVSKDGTDLVVTDTGSGVYIDSVKKK